MILSPDRACAGVLATLETEVLPHLTDEVARGQLFSALYVLSEMLLGLGASPDQMQTASGRQDALFAHVASLAQGVGLQPPLPQAGPVAPPRDQAEAQRLHEAGGRIICGLLDWCWTADRTDPAVQEIHRLLRSEMRHRIEDERRLTPRPMFEQITGG